MTKRRLRLWNAICGIAISLPCRRLHSLESDTTVADRGGIQNEDATGANASGPSVRKLNCNMTVLSWTGVVVVV